MKDKTTALLFKGKNKKTPKKQVTNLGDKPHVLQPLLGLTDRRTFPNYQ